MITPEYIFGGGRCPVCRYITKIYGYAARADKFETTKNSQEFF